MTIKQILILIPLLPLIAAAIVGVFRNYLPRWAGHVITIAGVGAAFVLSACIFNQTLNGFTLNEAVYTWLESGDVHFEVGFLIDNLSAMMMVVVTFCLAHGAYLHHRLYGGRPRL